MSMNVGGDGGGIKADINVTPLVDVMLVLLIIMMIVAPLLQQGAPLTLPTAANSAPKPEGSDQTTVAITADKRYFLNTVQVPKDDLARRVTEVLDAKGGPKIVIIKADVDAEYGSVMDAMDALRTAGIEDMGLITDPKSGAQAQAQAREASGGGGR